MSSERSNMRVLMAAVLLVLAGTRPALAMGLRYVGTGVPSADEENERVFLGGLFPIHKRYLNERCSGIIDLGVQRQEAMVFAVRNINRNPGILPGLTLAFDIRDTCIHTTKARDESLEYVSPNDDIRAPYYHDFDGNGTRNLTVHGVSGVVGAASSSVSIAVANLLRLFSIPQVSYASTAKILSDKSRFDYFFRTVPPDSLQARAMADIIVHFNWTYVIAMHSLGTYGTEGIRSFFNELDRLGVDNTTTICISRTIGVSSDASEAGFDEAVAKIDEDWVKNATVIVLFGQLAVAEGILEAVERRKRSNPAFAARSLTWIGSDAWGDQLSAQYHELAQGMLSVIPQAKISQDFDEYFQSLNPRNYTANPWFEEYWEAYFNCSFTNDTSLTVCNPDIQKISAKSGYRQNSKVTFTIDAVYSFAYAIDQLRRNSNCMAGGLCADLVDKRTRFSTIKGDLLLERLHNVSFEGFSADRVVFDSQGDQQGGYSIKNLQETDDGHIFKIVGSWDGISKRLSIDEEVVWSHPVDVPLSVCSLPCKGGEFPEHIPGQKLCCWMCRPCRGIREVGSGTECAVCDQGFLPNQNRTACEEIPLTYLTPSSPWSIIILLLSCSGLIVTSFVAAVFIVFNRHQIVKATSRELSAILLLGIMLCYFVPFFFIVKPSTGICVIRRFGVGFCFAVCYAALLVKANRIHRIFNRNWNTTQMPPLVSPFSQLFFTFLLVSVQVLIAIVWLVVERPGVMFVYDFFSTELKCNHSPLIGLSVSLCYNSLLLVLSTYFAFRTRKIPQNFNEAKFINLTVYTLCIIWIAFIPTYFATARLGTVYQTGSQMVTVILSATTTLCCLFIPKLYFLLSRVRKEHSSNQDSEGTQHHTQLHSHNSTLERRMSASKCIGKSKGHSLFSLCGNIMIAYVRFCMSNNCVYT